MGMYTTPWNNILWRTAYPFYHPWIERERDRETKRERGSIRERELERQFYL